MFIYQQNSSQDNQDENHEHETQEKQIVNNIFVPSFQTKFRDFVETSQMVSSNNDYQYTIQKSIETEEDQKDSKEIQIPNTFILKQPHKRNSNQQKQLENKHKFKLFRKDSIPEKDNLSQTPKSNYDEEKSTISKSGEILKQSQFYKSDFIIDSQANDKVQETIGNKRINSHKKKTLSHFESQFLILQSEQLQAEYIERFLNKCKNGQDINEVDARIISSMFKKK
ncbi:hypothetical protein ABPG73_018880 [Tetrahymena malaccensis]